LATTDRQLPTFRLLSLFNTIMITTTITNTRERSSTKDGEAFLPAAVAVDLVSFDHVLNLQLALLN
jgi:hypothetical protein